MQTYVEKHRLTSEDNELFPPSRDGSFVRPSSSSFGGRSSGSSFSTRRTSHSNGPPNLQRFSGAQAGPPNLQRFSAVARDVTSVKAQINGILHEDSLPYYDGSAQMPTQQIIPARQNSNASHAGSPRNRGTSTRLGQQGTSGDAGDLGFSSAAPMSRTDSGHISGQQHSHRNDHWQSRLRQPSSEQAPQRSSPTHGASPFASIEAMLSSIPETFSSIPSMPSMPSVPSMSEIDRSMRSGSAALQSGWSSFTGSLGLSTSAAEAQSQQQQQQQAGSTGWAAFEDMPHTAQSSASAAPPQPPVPSAAAQLDPFAELTDIRLGSTATQTASSGQAPAAQPGAASARTSSDLAAAASSASFTLPRRQPTGLQSIDPLNAAKEAASMPLRSMPSSKQPMTPRGTSQHQLSNQQSSADTSLVGSSLHSVTTSPSNNWSDFAVASSIGHSESQRVEASDRIHMQQTGVAGNAADTDTWASWQGEIATAPQQQPQLHDQMPTQSLDTGSKQASLLDL